MAKKESKPVASMPRKRRVASVEPIRVVTRNKRKPAAKLAVKAAQARRLAKSVAPPPASTPSESKIKPATTASASAIPTERTLQRTLENVQGQSVVGDFRPSDLYATAGSLMGRALKQPLVLAKASLGFLGELGKLAVGESKLQPAPDDRRFTDKAWQDNAVYAGLLQGYLALRKSLNTYAENTSSDKRQVERAQFLLAQIGDALAPNNFLFGNPAALRKAKETYGLSLVHGAKNLIGDVLKRRPIPSQVDEKAFKVGGNLAITKGDVVLRTEMFELIQYAAQTEKVRARPMLLVPSIVNKFYVFDLAPGRSVVEYFIKQGISVFVMVWRNPQRRHDRWGMEEYQQAIDSAIDATCAIRQSKDVNLWAVCGAGPVAVSQIGYYTATQQRKVNSLMLVVSPLDTSAMSQAPGIGAFVDKDMMPTPESMKAAMAPIKKTMRKRRMSAKEFSLLFAMLRANDLIWNYWVSNYLMGNTPAAFDVLYWNNDGTGMTAQFNSDFAEFVEANPFVTAGAMKVRGKAIADLSKLGVDSYVVGAANDHLCIWQGVYRSAQMLGPRSQFVLGNAGHIQTILNPPGNPKSSYCTNEDLTLNSEEWLAGATRHGGSWWDHCVAWTIAHAGALVPAPKSAGNKDHPSLAPAPGVYVHERS